MRAQSQTTTTTVPESTSSTTTPTTTPSTTASPTAPPGKQLVTYRGLRFAAPADWPVYDLAVDTTRCVRADEHAVYLGQQGPSPDCPARILGRTETVQVEPLDTHSQLDADRATQVATVNGLPARVDPDADTNRALTVVFPDQQLVVVITYRDDRSLADATLQTFTLA